MYLLLYFQSDDFSGESIFFTDFLNVCNATQVHKRLSTNGTKDVPQMHHGCTVDVQWKHQGCTLDAQWMLFECTTDAPRIHSHVLRMRQECLTVAPGMPHACLTGCTSNTI